MTLTLTLSVLAALMVVGLLLRVEYRLWREATERERSGTVPGAIASGRRAARQVLKGL